ncbi:MAG: 30S ribosomal protein S12 methylthiotransferase RimO [Deltaproteobacteria bacterium]|nr:MAG: 30S ribosomal protein S12 methylthiotransferase RimO [Deltaproteobacteria bacterium]TMB44513.1 MAG: 30S ribosomal protein S12 methylthiotransferase RimO [Deltaproteobacteria bacterium]
MTSRRVHLLTLGCPKNQVDSEIMLGVLARRGYEMVSDPEAADVLVVNTCAFITPAKEESIDAILDLAAVKAARPGRRLVVTGCLAQRYADDLETALPEVDVFVGTGDLLRIADAIEAPPAPAPIVYRGAQHVLPTHARAARVRTGAWWTAYVKVSEGCDHACSFCIIPKIRGRHESRPMDDLLAEAASLAAEGTVEICLIGQDLTAYGRDLAGDASLARLLRALAVRVPEVRWLRLLYAYPASVTDELLEVIADEPAVCTYLDMPLQHISDRLLRAMRRERSGAAIRGLIARIRRAVPAIALRTSFIVGFPGETEDDLAELCAFLAEAEFDHVGVFRYSREENTPAAALSGQVPEAVKAERWERVMAVQASVARRRAAAHRGRTIEVLVEGRDTRGRLVGRTRGQAPEIDGRTYLRGRAQAGDLVRARIVGAETYDLIGEIIESRPGTAVDTSQATL